MSASFSFGSISGATFAFWFFLALSLGIGAACGYLARQLSVRNAWLAGRGGVKWQSILLGVAMFVTIFSSVYLSMIDGFYSLAAEPDSVRLEYILPQRTLIVPRAQLAEVRTEVGPRNRWHLNLYQQSGARLSSAQGSYAEVRAAQKFLEAYLGARPESSPSASTPQAPRRNRAER